MKNLIKSCVVVAFLWTTCDCICCFGEEEPVKSEPDRIAIAMRSIEVIENDVYIHFTIVFFGKGTTLVHVPPQGIFCDIDFSNEGFASFSRSSETNERFSEDSYLVMKNSPTSTFEPGNFHRCTVLACKTDELEDMEESKSTLTLSVDLKRVRFPLKNKVGTWDEINKQMRIETVSLSVPWEKLTTLIKEQDGDETGDVPAK